MCLFLEQTIKIIVCWFMLCFQHCSPAAHVLHRHCIATQGTRFPKNIQFLLIDDVTVFYYNGSTGKEAAVPEWLNHAEGLEVWRELSLNLKFNRYVMDTAVKLTAGYFNHTDEHIYQAHGRCELNPDGTTQSFMSHAYDGKDFVSFDVQTKSWTAAVPQSVFYKRQREADEHDLHRLYSHYQYRCIYWLKRLLEYSTKVREDKAPTVRIFERSHPTEVTCHVTGFYPREVQVQWIGAGELPLVEGVKGGEVLPNGDGTYQVRKSLTVSEEVQKREGYRCLVFHSSVPGNITVTWAPKRNHAIWITILVLILLVLVVIVALSIRWRRN